MSRHSKFLAALLALSLAFSITACGKSPEPAQSDESSNDQGFVNTLPGEDVAIVKLPSYTDEVQEKKKENEHTVGWLEVPGTNINDVVVHYDKDNNYYWHRNFKQEQISIASFPNYENNNSWAYFTDFRNKFGSGKIDELSTNTVIYGHTYDTAVDKNATAALENDDTMGYGKRFAPLKYFYLNEDFAKKTPYVYFSTGEEDMVWEVFSVFFSTVNLPYNRPDLSADEHAKMLEEVQKRSVYTYDVDVTPNDKILTLSTCTYYIPGNTNYLGYPNDYRYVVMAKLIDKGDATKKEAAFTANPDHAAP